MWGVSEKRIARAFAFLVLIFNQILLENTQAQTMNYSTAMFVFGDSLSDVGNNNFILLSPYKANFYPYGIDYPGGIPTGRFSNGHLAIDFLASFLEFPVPRAYLSPQSRGFALLQGVNYASAGCGILNETSSNSFGCLSLSTQLRFHKNVAQRLVTLLGADKAKQFLMESLYIVNMGSNDFLGNFVIKGTGSPSEFINGLALVLTDDMKVLYHQNARRIIIIGLGSLGCIPSQRAQMSSGICNEELNSWAQSTNVAFRKVVLHFSERFRDALITFANPFDLATNFIQSPSKYGFTVANEACCGGGRLKGQSSCLPTSRVCSDRLSHIFWDAWHPTGAVNELVVRDFLSSNSTSVAPWSIKQVASGGR